MDLIGPEWHVHVLGRMPRRSKDASQVVEEKVAKDPQSHHKVHAYSERATMSNNILWQHGVEVAMRVEDDQRKEREDKEWSNYAHDHAEAQIDGAECTEEAVLKVSQRAQAPRAWMENCRKDPADTTPRHLHLGVTAPALFFSSPGQDLLRMK